MPSRCIGSCTALVLLTLVSMPHITRAQFLNQLPAAIQACTFRHPVSAINSVRDLPEPIRSALGRIADKGEPFNSTDVSDAARASVRFISAGQSGDFYFVWSERGGVVYSVGITLYRLRPGDNSAAPVTGGASEQALSRYGRAPRAMCRFTDDLLDGKPP